MKRFVMLLMLMSLAVFAAAAMPMMDANCLVTLTGTDVAVSDTPAGVALTLTTKAENVAELQRRAERMAATHSGDRPNEGMMQTRMMGAVKYEAIENGARLTLTPTDPGKLPQFRSMVRAHVERMKKGECSMMQEMMQGKMGGMGKSATEPKAEPEKDETDHSAHHPAGKP
jgi:hypothetical protein